MRTRSCEYDSSFSARMAAADPHAEADERRYDATLMRRLLGYLRPYKGLAALAVR